MMPAQITMMSISPDEWGDDVESAAFDRLFNDFAGARIRPEDSEKWDKLFDDAARETAAILAADPQRDARDATLPSARAYARLNLANLHEGWKAGDPQALTGAIGLCANHEIPLPDWVGEAFIDCHNKVASGEIKSWDDAIGRPYPKGAQVAAMKRRHMNRVRVWLESLRLQKKGIGSGSPEFHLVIGEKVHLERSQVLELLAEARTLYSWIPWDVRID